MILDVNISFKFYPKGNNNPTINPKGLKFFDVIKTEGFVLNK